MSDSNYTSTVASCKNRVTFACAPPGTNSWRHHWIRSEFAVETVQCPIRLIDVCGQTVCSTVAARQQPRMYDHQDVKFADNSALEIVWWSELAMNGGGYELTVVWQVPCEAMLLPRDAYQRTCIVRYTLRPDACRSVCYKPAFHRNDWINRAAFWHRGKPSAYLSYDVL